MTKTSQKPNGMEQLSRAGMEILGTHWNMKVFGAAWQLLSGLYPYLGVDVHAVHNRNN